MQFVTICKPAAAAQALPSMGLLPRALLPEASAAPDAQATFSGFVLNISPRRARGCIVTQSAQHFHTFFPPYSKYATGHGFQTADEVVQTAGGRVKSEMRLFLL